MPLSFLCANILNHLCSILTSNTLRHGYANLEDQRSHECERCTQECVRHHASCSQPNSPRRAA
jgi:hypothetical protein